MPPSLQPDDRYRLLAGLARLINSTLDLRKVFWRAAEQFHQHLGCQQVTLVLAEGVLEGQDGFAVEFEPIRWVNLPGRGNEELHAIMADRRSRLSRGTASLPLLCRDKAIGALRLVGRGDNPGWDIDLLSELATMLATALDNASAYAQVSRLKRQLENANTYLRDEIQGEHLAEMVGGLGPVRQAIDQVGPTDSTVLIQGETGTGKELVARAIHLRSPRHAQLLVKVNCGALAPTLITSELFGHEPGAFTGATRRRQGRFELAHKGTLFLDEVAEIPLDAQVLLLRVLQERQIERVGGTRPIPVDVRLIAAAHRDLSAEVQAGRFRADLYYRLNVFPIQVPPLRQRPQDIGPLVDYFVARLGRRMNKKIEQVSDRSRELLDRYHWPGNVRELENLIERAVIVAAGSALEIDPSWLAVPPVQVDGKGSLVDLERTAIIQALQKAGGKVYGAGGAAEALGLKPTTLYGKMRKLSIRKKAGSTQFE